MALQSLGFVQGSPWTFCDTVPLNSNSAFCRIMLPTLYSRTTLLSSREMAAFQSSCLGVIGMSLGTSCAGSLCSLLGKLQLESSTGKRFAPGTPRFSHFGTRSMCGFSFLSGGARPATGPLDLLSFVIQESAVCRSCSCLDLRLSP